MKQRLFYGMWFSVLGVLGLPLAFAIAWTNKNDHVGIETAYLALIFIPAIFTCAAIYGQRIASSNSWLAAFWRGVCIVLLSSALTAFLFSVFIHQNPLIFLSLTIFLLIAGLKGVPLLFGGLSGVALRSLAIRAKWLTRHSSGRATPAA